MSDMDDMFKGMMYDVKEATMGPARQQLAEEMTEAYENGQVTDSYLKTLVKAAKMSDEDAVKVSRLLPEGLSSRFLHIVLKKNHPLKYRLGLNIPIKVMD